MARGGNSPGNRASRGNGSIVRNGVVTRSEIISCRVALTSEPGSNSRAGDNISWRQCQNEISLRHHQPMYAAKFAGRADGAEWRSRGVCELHVENEAASNFKKREAAGGYASPAAFRGCIMSLKHGAATKYTNSASRHHDGAVLWRAGRFYVSSC